MSFTEEMLTVAFVKPTTLYMFISLLFQGLAIIYGDNLITSMLDYIIQVRRRESYMCLLMVIKYQKEALRKNMKNCADLLQVFIFLVPPYVTYMESL